MIFCGMPAEDVDYFNGTGADIEKLFKQYTPTQTQFTGSADTAEHLCKLVNGKIKIEDAGFDYKILGPDVNDIEYVAWQSDQDAYALAGQKCSAQSILFMHENWAKAGFIEKISVLAARRQLKDLTLNPILTWSNVDIQKHIDACLSIQGSKLLFGGKPIAEQHNVPSCYGTWTATAISIPLE